MELVVSKIIVFYWNVDSNVLVRDRWKFIWCKCWMVLNYDKYELV